MVDSVNNRNEIRVIPEIIVIGDLSKSQNKNQTTGAGGPSIFVLPGDKNNNNVIEYKDFDDEAEAKFFEEKGLIGKTWDYLKLHAGKILGINNATVDIYQKGFSNKNLHYQMKVDDNGNVTSYMQDYGAGTAYTQNFELDEKGNPVKTDIYSTNTKTGETYKYSESTTVNEYDDNGTLLKSTTTQADACASALGSTVNTYNPDGTLATHDVASGHDVYHYDEKGRMIGKNIDYDINNANFQYNSGKVDINSFKMPPEDYFYIP